jgi:hypothetical protein
VQWVQIHKTHDFAYFNHSVHINRGVSCVSCHGRVDQMDVVYQYQPLSMKWCLECHRAPENHLRPLDKVTALGWQPPQQSDELAQLLSTAEKPVKVEDLGLKPNQKISASKAQEQMGLFLKDKRGVHPPDANCFGCHR